MTISAGAVIPPAAVLAMAGWSCWTIVAASATTAAAKLKPIASVAGLLEPDLGAPAGRDPFAMPGEPEPTAKGPASGAPAAAKPGETPEARFRRLLAALTARLAAARAAEAKRAAIRERLAHLPLSATSVHPDRRVAILGGRAYAEGETIEGTEKGLGPVVLAEIRAKEVTVRSAAGPVVVRFADASAHPASAPPHPPAAKADAARRPRAGGGGGAVTIRGRAR